MLVTGLVAFFSLNLSPAWRRFVGLMFVCLIVAQVVREFTDWTAAPLVGLSVCLVFFSGMAFAAPRQVLFTGGVLQLHHYYHRRLWRYQPRHLSYADAGLSAGDYRNVLHGNSRRQHGRRLQQKINIEINQTGEHYG